jgi:hypothetical protein
MFQPMSPAWSPTRDLFSFQNAISLTDPRKLSSPPSVWGTATGERPPAGGASSLAKEMAALSA